MRTPSFHIYPSPLFPTLCWRPRPRCPTDISNRAHAKLNSSHLPFSAPNCLLLVSSQPAIMARFCTRPRRHPPTLPPWQLPQSVSPDSVRSAALSALGSTPSPSASGCVHPRRPTLPFLLHIAARVRFRVQKLLMMSLPGVRAFTFNAVVFSMLWPCLASSPTFSCIQ